MNRASARIILDEIDLKIVHMLSHDGRMSRSDLAENVGVSRPTINHRLAKLKKYGLLKIIGGLDLKAVGFKIAFFTIRLRNDGDIKAFEKTLTSCPRVFQYFQGPEANTLIIFNWGENLETLQSAAASYRRLVDLEMGDLNFLGCPRHGDILVRLCQDRAESGKCGLNCMDCRSYQNNMCSGCPHTVHYKHSFL